MKFTLKEILQVCQETYDTARIKQEENENG